MQPVNHVSAAKHSCLRTYCNIRYILLLLFSFVIIQLLTIRPYKCSVIERLLGKCVYNINTFGRQRQTSSLFFDMNNVTRIAPATHPQKRCPLIPPNLGKKFEVSKEVLTWKELEDKNTNLELGGRHRPSECKSRNKVAIVIPFRFREMHLKIFLNNIHPFLQRQQLDYGIYVVDLTTEPKFNRAMLMNIGFVEALKDHNYSCFIFHDVDLLPENGLNLYSCPEHPRHMSVAIDKLNYKLPYRSIFGGVVAMTKEQFELVNGFSNKYFGWGGEDDDMFDRIRVNNMSIVRYTEDIARYKMLSHKKDKANPMRYTLLKKSKDRWKYDGINSLKYVRLKHELRKLYTYILVNINEAEILSAGHNNKHNIIHKTDISS